MASLIQVDASQARKGLPELMNRVGYGHEHIAVARHGKVKVVMVDPEEYERYRAMEDLLDGLEAQKALEEFEKSGEKPIPYSQIREELRLGRKR